MVGTLPCHFAYVTSPWTGQIQRQVTFLERLLRRRLLDEPLCYFILYLLRLLPTCSTASSCMAVAVATPQREVLDFRFTGGSAG